MAQTGGTRTIEYLSPPAQVSMGDEWFGISPIDHFWVRRRFRVFQTLAGDLLQHSRDIAEIGCGHGLVQRQIEEAYAREVTGFDLNEFALQRNQSQRSSVCCYDISQRAAQFRHRFDFIVMFDVLEHIEDEDRFLQAVMFHLAPGGHLVVNVPAGQWLYSAYDQMDGHKRRYSIGTLQRATERNGYAAVRLSYWGLPLVPLVVLRKVWLARSYGDPKAVAVGFDSRNSAINWTLGWLSGCELLPQRLFGTSVMAVFRSPGG
jgi:SAM-dependent methyltransferase